VSIGPIALPVPSTVLDALLFLALAASVWDDTTVRARALDATDDFGLLAHDVIVAEDGLAAAVAALHGAIADGR
jgi:hypothetical protein